MEYIPTKTVGVYIQFDPTTKTAKVIDKTEAQKELEFNTAQLAALPTIPADKDLLAWAKVNYPQVTGVEQSKTLIEANITKLQEQVNGCK